MNASQKIEECKYIFLLELSEPEDNCLRLIVEEAKSDGPLQDVYRGDIIIKDVRAIESDNSCHLFEIVWPKYTAYSVRNESYTSYDKTEERVGKLFCIYSKSHFLDYVQKSTFAHAMHDTSLKHWGIICGNHIIDVVSHIEPQIKILSR